MSKSDPRILQLLLAACLVLLAFPADAQLLDEEVSARPGERLRIDLETGGRVTIQGWDRDAVAVRATAPDATRYRASVERQGDTVAVKSDYIDRQRSWSSNVRFEISVPRAFDIDLDSTGGGIHISGVEGRFEGRTMGGEIELRQLAGHADLETMGGDVLVVDSELDGKVSTMGGEVTMRDVYGDLDGSSMGGNVTLDRVTRRDGSSTGDAVIISTMGGSIEVADAPSGAKLHTMGGAIRVDSAAEYVDAETMGGNIDLGAVDGWVKAVTMGGDIEVRVTGEGSAGADILLQSMSGDVRLTVPRGFGMTVDVEIAYTKRHAGKHEIKSDLPLQLSESDGWDYEHGDPRRYLVGQGTLGDGRHRVEIRTVNGDVILEEE